MKDEREHLQLFDLIAREWVLPSPATRLTFNRAGTAVAFDCADGSIHLATTTDKASPNSRIRRAADTGRLTISPRAKPFPPLKTAEFTKGRASPVVPHDGQNFAFARENGRINTLTPGGTALYLAARAPAGITAIATSPVSDTVAFACADTIHIGPAKIDAAQTALRACPGHGLGVLAGRSDAGSGPCIGCFALVRRKA